MPWHIYAHPTSHTGDRKNRKMPHSDVYIDKTTTTTTYTTYGERMCTLQKGHNVPQLAKMSRSDCQGKPIIAAAE